MNQPVKVNPFVYCALPPDERSEVLESYILKRKYSLLSDKSDYIKDRVLDSLRFFIEDMFDLQDGGIMNKTRKLRFAYVRQIFCYCAKRFLKLTVSYIGRYLEMDHSTVIYAYKKVDDLMLIYQDTKDVIDKIKDFIDQGYDHINNYYIENKICLKYESLY